MSMKGLYVHDHVFVKDCAGFFYSEGKITDSVFDRYAPCCSVVFVLARCREVGGVEGLTRITKSNVFFCPVRGLSFFKVFSFYLFENFKRISRLVRETDFVILRLPSFIGVVAFVFSIAYRRPYFVELVGDPGEAIRSSAKGGFSWGRRVLAAIMEKATRHAVKNAPGVIYVTSESLQKKFPAQGFSSFASNVDLVVDDLSFSIDDYEISGGDACVGMVGSFSNNYKGVDSAIKAVSLLRSRGVRCKLRVLGSGNSQPYIALARSLGVEDSVFFDGIRSGGRGVYDWLDGLDVYIQPSRTEGLPRSLIEAMSRGLPCIGSDAGGIPELLPAEWVFSKESPERLAEKLETLLLDHNGRYIAGCNNYVAAKSYSKDSLSVKRRVFWEAARDYLNKGSAI